MLASTNAYYDIPTNYDGSIDPYPDAAFVETVSGHLFLVALRLSATEHAFYDQTWRPDDLAKVT